MPAGLHLPHHLHLHKRIEQLLFEPAHQPAIPPLRLLLSLLRYPYALGRDLLQGDLNLRAMGLVYTTLLSVVPLVAFAFAILKGLEMQRDLEPLILEFLRPIGDRADEMTGQMMAFVENTRGGVLGSLGLAFLVYTVLSTVQKLEESFNFAWHVEQPRSVVRRVSEYLSLIVLGPIFIVVVLGLFGALTDSRMSQWLASHEPFGSMLVGLGIAGPYLVVTAAFTFLYVFVPNTRVQWKAALAGGLLAGILWAASGALFAKLVVASTRLVAIYAGFAIFLSTLIWVYISWFILLVGAQLSFYVQNPRYLRAGQKQIRVTSRLRERLALSVMFLVGRSFLDGRTRWTVQSLAERLEVPSSALASVTDSLETAGLLVATEDERLVPGKAIDRIGVHAILNAVRDEQQYESWLLA
ncbi:MAG: YihY/virulence factor BrkB family protein, partial [Steroidobacteraceae bacterium]|nr:YihY/virulence factor BrkB family protein [Steroidobacteraceae bacterium]